MSISIRVSAKTVVNEYRTIVVADDGSSTACDCGGFGGAICSHIDAVLVAQERAMVHEDDWAQADQAVAVVAGRIVVPEDWRASWRKNLRWRGLSRQGVIRRVRDESKPRVCFTGPMDRPRAELREEAERCGWEVMGNVGPSTDVLVAADPTDGSRKLQSARKNATPIVTPEEWTVLMIDGVFPA